MPESQRMYELKLAAGARPVRWPGICGEDAARRYVDAHPEAAVLAWREDRSPCVLVLGDPRRVIP